MNIQQLLVIALVAISALYVGKHLWESVASIVISNKKEGSCPGCGKCSYAKQEKKKILNQQDIIALKSLKNSDK